MKTSNRLSTLQLPALLKKPGRHRDGDGLILLVRDNGAAFWVLRYMLGGKARELGLGPLRLVNLAEARQRAREARQALLDKRDPLEIKHAAMQARKVEELKTLSFREACERFLATDRVENFRNAKHRQQWRSTLAKAYPVLGDLPLQSIDSAILLRVLLPVMKATPETGSRLRGRIERVIEWARPLGLFAGPNPAAREALKDHLPAKRKAESHKALPYAELGAFMARLRERESVSAKALEFTILTAARTGETIGARWEEIDLKAKTWSIAGERMKAGKPHRVPLSPRALEILRACASTHNGDSSQHVFAIGGGKPLSTMAMLELLRGMAGNGYTVHGFRSSFSDWAHDRTGFAPAVIELALAHTIGDKTAAAYRRGDALDKRAKLMSGWCRFLENVDSNQHGENIVSLRA